MVLLHHEISGPADGPALLLGSSLGTTLRMWDRQRPLAERLRVVAFDHRGHGGSPVPPGPYTLDELAGDVLALMDRLEVERADFCGLSLGGMVGMWLGAHAPERIDRLILMCTSAHMPPASAWEERIETIRRAGSVEPLADAVAARWLTPRFAEAHPDVHAELRAMLAGSPPEGYAGCCAAIAQMDLRGSLSQVTAPTLVISGADDPSTPVAIQEEIAGLIPDARHEVVASAAHLAAVEQPAAVNRLMLEFLGASQT